MSIQAALRHVTRYRYDRPIALGPQTIRLRPAPHCRAKILAYALKVEPETHFLNWQQDPQSNWLARIVVPEKTDHFTVSVDLTVDMEVINPFDFFLEPEAEQFPFAYCAELKAELEPYLRTRDCGGPALRRAISPPSAARRSRPPSFLFDLNARLTKRHRLSDPHGARHPDAGRHAVQGIRLLPRHRLAAGAAAAPSGPGGALCLRLSDPAQARREIAGWSFRTPTQDFTDLHAWCEVYLPGAGWVGLDPTSGLFAGEGHIPLACAANPTQAAPISRRGRDQPKCCSTST